LDEADVKEKSGTYDKLVGQMAEFNDKAVNLEETRHQLEQAKAKEAQARQDVGAAQQRVDVLQTLKEKLTEVDEQKEGIARQISQLGVLEKAFSKDGIPALLIEQALPEIETEANRILSELTGGSMSVSFSTQKEFKDKKRDDLKETLDIVIDTNGDTREYETLSGGEAFRVNFAIRLALSGFLARRAGAKLQMLVIDEGFGSQDESGRQRLVEAINAVADKFEKILVVTHIESLKDAFPTRIEVSKTENGSTISIV
jgi:exonuclease SbcC